MVFLMKTFDYFTETYPYFSIFLVFFLLFIVIGIYLAFSIKDDKERKKEVENILIKDEDIISNLIGISKINFILKRMDKSMFSYIYKKELEDKKDKIYILN